MPMLRTQALAFDNDEHDFMNNLSVTFASQGGSQSFQKRPGSFARQFHRVVAPPSPPSPPGRMLDNSEANDQRRPAMPTSSREGRSQPL